MNILLSLLFLSLVGAFIILWPIFVIWIVTRIHFTFVYWTSYVYARIFYKKDRYEATRNLQELEEELKQMEHEELRFILNRCFGTTHKVYYDVEQHNILIWKKQGYKKGLQVSMRCK